MTAFATDVQVLQTLKVHTSDVNSVDFAGDCILVTASGDKRVRVWEWQKGLGYVEAPYSPLMGHKYGVTSVKVSPQSTMLASASIDGTTHLWNLRSGARIHTMVQAGGEAVRACRFSPDSTLLVTAGDSGQVCVWDLVHRNLIRSFQQHEGAVQSVCFSPDSCWLVTSCTFGVLKLFSSAELSDTCTSDNQVISALTSVDDAHDLGVVSCDFSSYQEVRDNEPFKKLYHLVTCGNDHTVKFWEVFVVQNKCETHPSIASLNLCRTMEKHSSALTCVRFNSNGSYIVSSGLDKTSVIWETRTGKILAVLGGHKRYVACCAFSRDGNLIATGSNDKSVIVWDLNGNLSLDSDLVKRCSPKRHYTYGGEIILGEHEVVKQAECTDNKVSLIQRIDDHGGAVNSVAFYGNTLLASGSGDKSVRIWEAVEIDGETYGGEVKFEEKSFGPLEGHKYSVNHVEFSPCGTMLASCSLDGTTIVWDTEMGGRAKANFVNSGSGIRVCRWSPNGKMIATAGDDEKTTLWNVDTMEEMQVFEGHSDAITAIAFTPDSSYLVTACSEGTWRLFDDINTHTQCPLIFCEQGHDLGVQDSDFSPVLEPVASAVPLTDPGGINRRSYLLATCGNDSLVKLWHITIFIDVVPVSRDEELYNSISTSNVTGQTYKLWKSMAGHGGNVMSVRFSPINGEILGSVATDRTARLWSVYSGVCLHVLENHDSLVTACAFAQDSSLFVTGALDKTVLVWKLPQQLVSQSILADRLRKAKKRVADWKFEEVARWFREIELPRLAEKIQGTSLSGRHLLTMPEQTLVDGLQIEDEETMETFVKQLYWLRREDSYTWNIPEDLEIPHEFLCPITHEVMREPVQCSDGFTYERAAINEWLLSGKYSSPMTNAPLRDTKFVTNVFLKNKICSLLFGDQKEE
ncbi:WD repeat, SAM and U-box domain-containing protein 1-like [Diprion similis]|uniref:WD repeat, SAM and U-box domain-containing protein 1-like n=1 Tax=Diprion similis TaxID=362088 RepID=UPI001EF7EEE4|nr:WD repeat, SAM and U-box domain-containing protein 1-like [Diprion similis]XP_046734063.1 WD repeat, SAM and U-box domain-containing protein 1-like [Diprion similis]